MTHAIRYLPSDPYGRAGATVGDFPTREAAEDESTERCVICQASISETDSGLCGAHKYDEQMRPHP